MDDGIKDEEIPPVHPVIADPWGYVHSVTANVERLENLVKEPIASEALYGFCGWLTCRDVETKMGSSNDCAGIADLINRFCKENKLADPRDGWESNLAHPD